MSDTSGVPDAATKDLLCFALSVLFYVSSFSFLFFSFSLFFPFSFFSIKNNKRSSSATNWWGGRRSSRPFENSSKPRRSAGSFQTKRRSRRPRAWSRRCAAIAKCVKKPSHKSYPISIHVVVISWVRKEGKTGGEATQTTQATQATQAQTHNVQDKNNKTIAGLQS